MTARFHFALLLLLPCFWTVGGAQRVGYNPSGHADQTSIGVSVIQLIANPKKWDGKKIRVIGFLRLEFEGDALYLHQEDYERAISENGIWIKKPGDLTPEQVTALNNHYVLMEGTFSAGSQGQMGMFAGRSGGSGG